MVGGGPGTVLMRRPGTEMRATAPWHEDPAAVTLHGTPNPTAWRRKAARMISPDSEADTVTAAKGPAARASDSASFPAT